MQGNIPQTYTISDFIEWQNRKQLVLDPSFQRGAVWTKPAQAFLIDTILNQYPVPQIYLRTRIDPVTQTSVREVVDGQQRLRTILEFASDKLNTGNKASQYPRMKYSDLPPEAQEIFLSYRITTVQLIDANDADVLEVFARLNSYSVKVTPAELRHAKYSEPVKWAIWNATREWRELWDDYKVVSVRDSIRLKNTSLMAELFMSADNGLNDGGETAINKYYSQHKSKPEEYFEELRSKVDKAITFVTQTLGEDFVSTTFFNAPNFTVLIGTLIFLVERDTPETRVTEGLAQFRNRPVVTEGLQERLMLLEAAIENDDLNGPLGRFVTATRSSTQRWASRKTRAEFIARALLNENAA